MNIFKQVAVILKTQNVETFCTTEQNSQQRVVLWHPELWQRKILFVLSSAWFLTMGVGGNREEELPGCSLCAIACDDEKYREWTLLERMEGSDPWELARSVVDIHRFFGVFEPDEFLSALDLLADGVRTLERKVDDKVSANYEFFSDKGKTGYALRANMGDSEDYYESYNYHKTLYDLLMESVNILLSPIDFNSNQ